MLAKRFTYLKSSQDPTKVSLLLKSILPLIVLILAAFKVDIPEIEIETILLTLASIANGCVSLYAFIRKYIK